MTDRLTYEQFLSAKVNFEHSQGLACEAAEINPKLFPHQRDIVLWAVRGGRRAIFAAFGLGKSFMQLEIGRLVEAKAEKRFLIVAPLGVRQEFKTDARKLGTSIRFVRRIEECGPRGIYITNYETVRDGKLDPRDFAGVSLDEASILRGFGGTKTFREMMRLFEGTALYRFVATATPSPNEYIELLAYAAFLDVMDVGQAKTRFFKRDSTKADELTLHPHKQREFWLWVSTWAIFLQKPSDLGYSDVGYALPKLQVHWHEIPSDHRDAGVESNGQGKLLRNAAISVSNAAREKRDSLDGRIAKMLELRAEAPGAHRLIWHDLESERAAIEDVLPVARYGRWLQFKDGNSAGLTLYERHYSARKYADGRERELFCGPGEKMVLLTNDAKALFVWRKFIDDSGQKGINCAVFRNEGEELSSGLIREAMAAAWLRWPAERLYTYINPDKIESSNPGYCFLAAGWRKCGETKDGLVICEATSEHFGADPFPYIKPELITRSVYGSQDLEEREKAIIDFSDGKIQELAAKPVIAGSGCNFQRHCHWAIFLGIGFKFNDFIQAVHRIHRFLQDKPVRIDLIYTEAEREVRQALERKWTQHIELTEQMAEIIREYGLASADAIHELRRSIGCERTEVKGDNFTLVNNDSVVETQQMAENSVHLILSSIPFSTQYEYTPSYNDFGHTDSNPHFFEQMDYLTPQLFRALKPGRVAAIHVKDRIVPGGMTGLGFQTVYPFHSEAINHFIRHGFAFLGMKTIVTDVVRENNQTYRLGWTEQCKDGSRMGFGMPEYLLLFRKPPTDSSNGYADEPVVKDKEKYSRSRWQVDAHGFARSNGNRLLSAEEFAHFPHERIFKLFREHSLTEVYDFEEHVRLGESLEGTKRLPVTFMLLQPQSWHPDVWTDITRMLTLNGAQSASGREMHLCPMQFDLADRVIAQFTMEGETVLDPFAGLGTVPYRALKLRRKGIGIELSAKYFLDAVAYCKAAEQEAAIPDLFGCEAAAVGD